jgi:hypothetical protein
MSNVKVSTGQCESNCINLENSRANVVFVPRIYIYTNVKRRAR